MLDGAHVDDHRQARRVCMQQPVEFVDVDARAGELAQQRAAAVPAHAHVKHQQGADQHQGHLAELARAGEQPVDLGGEQQADQQADGGPQQRAERVIADEGAVVGAQRARHRHRDQRQARHEARDRQHAHAPATEELLGFLHATVARQRQPADRLQGAPAEAAPGQVPGRIAEHRRQHRQQQHRHQLDADHVGMHGRHRAEQHERRHRGHGQAERGSQHIDEHDQRSVLGDEVMQHGEWDAATRDGTDWMRRLSTIFKSMESRILDCREAVSRARGACSPLGAGNRGKGGGIQEGLRA